MTFGGGGGCGVEAPRLDLGGEYSRFSMELPDGIGFRLFDRVLISVAYYPPRGAVCRERPDVGEIPTYLRSLLHFLFNLRPLFPLHFQPHVVCARRFSSTRTTSLEGALCRYSGAIL